MTIKKFFSVGVWVLLIALCISSIVRISSNFNEHLAAKTVYSEIMGEVAWILIAVYFILVNYRDEK